MSRANIERLEKALKVKAAVLFHEDIYALIGENEDLRNRNECLEHHLDLLLEGLDSNFDDSGGLSSQQWEQRIQIAREVRDGGKP